MNQQEKSVKDGEENWKEKFEYWLTNNMYINKSTASLIIDHVARYFPPQSSAQVEGLPIQSTGKTSNTEHGHKIFEQRVVKGYEHLFTEKDWNICYLRSEYELQIESMKRLGVMVDVQMFEQCVNALIFMLERNSASQSPTPVDDEEPVKVTLSNPEYVAYSSLNDKSIPQQWHQLWHEIEVWYGDVSRSETAEDLIKRLQVIITASQSPVEKLAGVSNRQLVKAARFAHQTLNNILTDDDLDDRKLRNYSEQELPNVFDTLNKALNFSDESPSEPTVDALRVKQAKERIYWQQLAEAAEEIISCVPIGESMGRTNLYLSGFYEAVKKWQSLKQQTPPIS